ncbi:UPF0496 protein At3g19330-like isoform X2 [Prosopis cineraria]|uniref:UPF0496 protein At3g19330-like isoform X2 n=1 Tax=Prosopis cineraria TaxID=364024 RepID=UPI00240FA809|nr:UPF0496 protein At3g19330-like isoform X2 [Prosopis cineraria]
MLKCLSSRSLTSLSSASAPAPNPPAPLGGHLTEHTPVASTQSSPAPNVSLEFDRAVLSNSVREIQSIIEIEVLDPSGNDPPRDQPQLVDGDFQRRFLEKLLQPDRDCVQKALVQLKSDSLTHLISTYFDRSEAAVELCFLLLRCLRCARIMYAPLRDLLHVLPFDSGHLTQSQCDRASDIFFRFDTQDNPFSSSDSLNLSRMRSSFSELDQQLRCCLKESRSKLRLLRGATAGSALCFIATAVGVVATAVVVATHALVAIAAVAAPVCPAFSHLMNPQKKELARLAQLEAASRVTFALKQHIDSTDRLVVLLHGVVEADKHSVRLGLEMGNDRYAIQEVVKLLRKRYESLRQLMEELETTIYISVNFVNRTRSNLLRQICIHQNA